MKNILTKDSRMPVSAIVFLCVFISTVALFLLMNAVAGVDPYADQYYELGFYYLWLPAAAIILGQTAIVTLRELRERKQLKK